MVWRGAEEKFVMGAGPNSMSLWDSSAVFLLNNYFPLLSFLDLNHLLPAATVLSVFIFQYKQSHAFSLAWPLPALSFHLSDPNNVPA